MITVITHNGDFHPDDVFAVATLELVYGNIEVLRSRNPETIDLGDVVVDVGGEYDPARGRFDHHQEEGAGTRENGIPYAAFGLVWKHFGVKLCGGSEEAARRIDGRLVAPLDANDNGITLTTPLFENVSEYTFGDLAWVFRPTWKEGGVNQDAFFLEAVSLAKKVLVREIRVHLDHLEGEEFVEEAYRQAEDKRIIVLDRDYPWMNVLMNKKEPLFCVYPKQVGVKEVWRIKAVRTSFATFENRKDLPLEWRGKRDEELEEVTGVEGTLFVHNAGFMGVATTKEAALDLARLSVDT